MSDLKIVHFLRMQLICIRVIIIVLISCEDIKCSLLATQIPCVKVNRRKHKLALHYNQVCCDRSLVSTRIFCSHVLDIKIIKFYWRQVSSSFVDTKLQCYTLIFSFRLFQVSGPRQGVNNSWKSWIPVRVVEKFIEIFC